MDDSESWFLQELETRYPEFISPDSPTQRVAGAPSEKFARVRHLVPMLSLDKIAAADAFVLASFRTTVAAGGFLEDKTDQECSSTWRRNL